MASRNSAPSPEIRAHAEDLYAILGSPFERDLDMLDFRAHFDLPVSPNSAVFNTDSKAAFFMMLVGRELAPDKEWGVDVEYIKSEDTLGFSRVEIPLKAPRPESLLLQRVRSMDCFIPFVSSNATITELKTPFDNSDSMSVIPPDTVKRIMDDVGYSMPELFTSPPDLRLHLAEMADKAINWSIEESVVIPEDPELQTTITRVHSSSKRVFTKLESPKRSDVDIQLTAVGEFIDSDNKRRRQLVIEFNGSDYNMGAPTVALQELQPDSKAISVLGNEGYVCVRRQEKKVTAKLLANLIEGLVDTMTGN